MKDKSKSSEAKRTVSESWLEGDHILVHLDSRRKGVEVPTHLANDPALALKISYLFQGETTVNEKGITSYLRFGADYQKCVVPWEAIWGLTSAEKENKIWPEDMPKELVFKLLKNKVSQIKDRVLKGKDDNSESAEDVDTDKVHDSPANNPKKKDRRNILKRIK